MPSFKELIDLASERLGGSVLYANDDFFAEKENLIKPGPAIWKEHEYTDRGKWMDGWESRRKRTSGHDFAIVRLGAPGVIRGVVIDTSFFRGNYPDSASIDGVSMHPNVTVEELLAATWRPLLPAKKLEGNSANEFKVDVAEAVTHLRLNIFPDGGVARLRVHGEIVPEWNLVGGLGNEIDLAAVENGADVLACSDQFFGPRHNLIMPGRAKNMSDGWETRRRRGPGHDWVIVRLATEGSVGRIELDTNHFKGNYPDTASIEGSIDGQQWSELLPRTKLQAHTRHYFDDALQDRGPFRQLRMNVYPDGGVSRLRVWGVATEAGRHDAVVARINSRMSVESELRACCGATRWVEKVAAGRPYKSWDALAETSDRVWSSLEPEQWKEAFAAHPRIGEQKSGARWTAQEQSRARQASEGTLRELAEGNRAYEQKFGHVFLICATGRSADEILGNLRERINNDPMKELQVAAEEQRKITRLRLEKLVM